MSFSRTIAKTGVVAMALTFAGVNTAQADVIGHWRFENSSDLGQATVGPNLSQSGTVSYYELPETGPGSAFPTTIPQTGTSNEAAARILSPTADTGYLSSSTGVDSADLRSLNVFTFEAFANIESITVSTNNYYLAGQWGGGSDRRWAVGAEAGTGNVLIVTSSAGTNTSVTNTGLTMTAGQDYYIGVALDGENGEATVYLKNLTTDGELQTVTIASGLEILNTIGGDPFVIGRLTTSSNSRWHGLVDEVRVTSGLLDESQLMIVPEPASMALLGLGGSLMLLRRCGQTARV
ncbi:LamG-like jellyroll fold domain-containing protein [Phycisphaerales bacterium AB-hyl4]|uniref:LamG-like jellyroll fold domain-containing protein n=1 Tax=Natronomicrosphaera hydrolytica TaxID=3242702 RepID=A0ABV4UA61_9BACT